MLLQSTQPEISLLPRACTSQGVHRAEPEMLHSLFHAQLGCRSLTVRHLCVLQAHFHQEGPIQVLKNGLPCSSSSSPLLSRNCGSSHALTSSIGSVLTLGCSNTTRVHFACSIFLVGLRHSISWLGTGLVAGLYPGAPVALGRLISRSSYPCARSGQRTRVQ